MSVRDPLSVRVWRSVCVGQEDECWPWLAGLSEDGYGKIQDKGKTLVVTRVIYELAVGPIPPGKLICHSCDNPPCCNPKHLWPGTVLENAQDAMRKNRLAKGERIASSQRTTQEVLRIIEMAKQGIKNIEISRITGFSEANIGFIVTGKSWVHLTGGAVRPIAPKRKLTESQARIIKGMPFEIITMQEVAEILGVRCGAISRIVSGKRWGHIQCESA